MPTFSTTYDYYLGSLPDSTESGHKIYRSISYISLILLSSSLFGYIILHWISIYLIHWDSTNNNNEDIIFSYSYKHVNALYFNQICYSFFVSVFSCLIPLILLTVQTESYIFKQIFIKKDKKK
eukprot:489076_1